MKDRSDFVKEIALSMSKARQKKRSEHVRVQR
jgi:hypothetical protein